MPPSYISFIHNTSEIPEQRLSKLLIYFTWATFSDTLCFIFATLGRKIGPRLSLAGPSLSLPGSQSMSFRLSENLVRFLASCESLDAWLMTLARNRCPTPPVMRLNAHSLKYTCNTVYRKIFSPVLFLPLLLLLAAGKFKIR